MNRKRLICILRLGHEWNWPSREFCVICHTIKIPRWHWVRLREHEGMELPSKLLGFAYRDFDRDVRHFYLIPFNLFIALGRWFLEVVRFRITHKLMNRKYYHQLRIAELEKLNSRLADAGMELGYEIADLKAKLFRLEHDKT